MQKLLDLLKRNSVWLLPALLSILLLKPAIEEINTILLVILFEAVALSLSGLALYAYTRIDFIKTNDSRVIGFVFLGVHFCIGLTVLGVYIAQFGGG